MEFAEFIKTPKVEGVVLRRVFQRPLEGTLCITAHHLILSSRKRNNDDELWVQHTSIDSLEKKLSGPGGVITLRCKDFRLIQLEFPLADDCINVASSLETLSNISEAQSKYPFFYRATFEVMENGWQSFLPEREFVRFKECSEEWRLSYVNKDYSVCETYPHAVIVPKAIDDESLRKIATFRQGGRFPVLSYYHNATQSVLMRSSQPMTGQSNRRCKEDEQYLSSILGLTRRGYIVDTRSTHHSKIAQTKGGGFETDYNYCQWKRVQQPIERPHMLHDSLIKLIEATSDNGAPTEKWLSKLESSNWLTHVKDILTCACLVAQSIDKELTWMVADYRFEESRCCATYQCAHSSVRGTPPSNRFEALIEREWLQAGHAFESRCSRSAFAITKQRQEAPVFLLFLDCVWQIMQQFPCSFEFSDLFLTTLFEHAYSSQFGTFMCNTEFERKVEKLSSRTVSIWSYINRPEKLQELLNPLYDPNTAVMWPSVAPQSLKLWSGLYQRQTLNPGPTDDAQQEVTRICERNKELSAKVVHLRRQLASLERDAINSNIIIPAGLDISDFQDGV